VAEVKVNIETPGLTISDCMIPDDYTPERVIADVLEELNLPRMADTGQVITYSLLHVNHNLMLPDTKTLVESGVQSGDTLQVVPSDRSVVTGPGIDPVDVGLVGGVGDLSPNGEVEVVLSVLDLNRSERVTLPREASVSEIIRSIAADYNLPSRDKLNETITYRLESKALARFLGNGETLGQAGIPRLDRLSLHREEIAGAKK
jgi:hypothetical protein